MANRKNIWAILMTKDADDLIHASVSHILEEGIDGVIVSNNMSTDNTQQELDKLKHLYGDKVIVVQDNEVAYYQSKKMTALANKAHYEFGAEWIIAMDDDELWFSPQGKISDVINELSDSVNVIRATLYNHFPTGLDPEGIIPFETIQWRQNVAGALPKIAFKWMEGAVIEQGNHGVYLPYPHIISNCLEIRHFPYRTWEQFKKKAINGGKAYAATNLPESVGAHWRGYFQLLEKWGDSVVEWEVFRKHFYFINPIDNGLVLDPAPFRRWNKL